MGILKTVGSIILTLLIIVTLTSLVLVTNVKSTVLTPSIYTSTIDKVKISDIFSSLTNDMQSGSPEESQQFVSVLSNSPEVEKHLKIELTSMIESVFLYIDGRSNNVKTNISLQEIRPKLIEVIMSSAETLPVCAEQETENCIPPSFQTLLPKLSRGETITADDIVDTLPECDLLELPNLDSGVPSCITNSTRNEVTLMIESSGILDQINQNNPLTQIDENIPDSLELFSDKKPLDDARQIVSIVNQALTVSYILITFLFVILILIHKQSLKQILKWSGIPLLISGLLLGAVIAAISLLRQSILSSLSSNMSDAPNALSNVLTDLINQIILTLYTHLVIYAGVILGLGIGLIMYSKIIPSKEQSKKREND